MKLVFSCRADNYDTLAGMIAAGKIYTGSKLIFVEPPAPVITGFMSSHPDLFSPAGDGDLAADIDQVVLIGPCGSTALEPYREVLDRAPDIHLFSFDPEDGTLFRKAKQFIRPVAAVTTIFIEEIQRRNITLSKWEAGLLTLGIYDRTSALTSLRTTVEDVGAVYYLWKNGLAKDLLRPATPYQPEAGPESPPVETMPEAVVIEAGGDKPLDPVEPLPKQPCGEHDPGGEGPRCPGEGLETGAGGIPSPAWMEWDSLLPLLTTKLTERLRGKLLLIGQAGWRRKSAVYLVGGVIRDLFLDREPARDLDLVVVPEAIPLAYDLQKCLGGKLLIYEQLGTATLFLSDRTRLDLATARRELYLSPGALPEIEPSGLKFDLYRRDFTINSIACSLIPESYGRLYDYYCGRPDLAKGLLRTMYNLSFVDDPLRILRAVRFEKRLGFRLEENTRKCMQKAINERTLEKVSRQRLSQEMSLIFTEPDPPGVLKKLDEYGALRFIYPRLQTTPATWQRLEKVKQSLQLLRGWNWSRLPEGEASYIGALLYDMEEDRRAVLLSKLNLSREKLRRILTICTVVPQILNSLSRDGLSPSCLVSLLQELPPEGLLLAFSLAESNREQEYLASYVNSFCQVRPQLRGNDLIGMGLEPGPIFHQILQGLQDAVLDGRVCTLEEERRFVRSLIQGGG